MGLLEKAQQKKQVIEGLNDKDMNIVKESVEKPKIQDEGQGKKTSKDLLEKTKQRKKTFEKPKIVEEKSFETPDLNVIKSTAEAKKTTGNLLEKVRQGKQVLEKQKTLDKSAEEKKGVEELTSETVYSGVSVKESGQDDIEVLEEKEGFGWNGLGKRRIVFDHTINEYVYLVSEPELNEADLKTKNELARLFKMLADINVTDLEQEDKGKYLQEILEQIIIDNDISFDYGSKDKIFYHIFRDFIGYNRINIVMLDEGIEDISCDGSHVPIFLHHRKYEAISTNIQFGDAHELDSFVVRLSQICGKQISIYSPIVDGKLPDGSRLQTTLAKTVTSGSTFTIRRFKENPLTPIDLINFQTISVDMAAYFWMAIENGASILLCGGTASGKTTALNALSLFIPSSHKIISIEDTREVSLPHKNWIAGTTRQGFSSTEENKTGKDIDMFDLIRAALRQRPRVIIVGEVRGKEAYSLFQAMATGHTSYATVHASTIHTLIQRLENPPISLPRALLTSLDIIIFLNAIHINEKSTRRMTSVTEIIKLDPDTNQLIFMEPFNWVSKTDDRFESSGASKVLNNIRLQNDWTEERIMLELENRKLILRWMVQKKIRDYKEVGRLVADYNKYPDVLLEKAMEELKN